MCGVCGVFTPQSNNPDQQQAIVRRMVAMMQRRGPDDEGIWHDPANCTTLGFRRLAILDLSPTGHQPMLTPDERYVLVYNGELYNYAVLKQELEQKGVQFRSTGDSEVVLQSLAHWGPDVLARFNGMFALAFYDRAERTLLLARDHAGIKPIYYAATPQGVVFGSQYNQLMAHPWCRNLPVSQEALSLYLRLGYVPHDYGILAQTQMVGAGCWVRFSAELTTQSDRYYTLPAYQAPDLCGEEAYEAVNAAVERAVQQQMISDVPIGAFLSGGIDSPLVVSKMQALSNRPIKAFTIGVPNDTLDESHAAEQYAQQLGVEHTLKYVTPDDAVSMLDDVVAACGEPFADYSIFPTMLVSKLARQQVTVMLSGDGGDELFWGYAGRFGSILRRSAEFQRPRWRRAADWYAYKYLKLGDADWNTRYFQTIGEWQKSKHYQIYDPFLAAIFPKLPAWPPSHTGYHYSGWRQDETAQWLRWNEFTEHLSRVLLKVDRASMHHSIEVRVPLLDKEVIAASLRVDWRSCLDLEQKVGKIPLRRALAHHVETPTSGKRGFSIPMATWLRQSLKPIFEQKVLARRDLLGLELDQTQLRILFDQHTSGSANHAWGLWILLSLALWEERYVK